MNQQTRQQVAAAVKAIESKKGEDLVVLEMDRNSGAFTDYFLVCSGTNPRQIQAIADEVERELGPVRANSVEGYTQAEWVLLDFVDFVVHVFSERARKFYDLERLWKSAKRLTANDLLKPMAKKGKKTLPPAKSRKRTAVSKSRVVKTKTTARKRGRKAS